MADLTESRLSEIRESNAKDRMTLERARDIIHGASSNLSDAANRETGRESKRLHALSREYLQVAMDVERMLARPFDLEALLAEREGMKAEIDKQRDELASYAEEREMLRIIFGCPERARRIMSTLDSLRDRLSAPLDPSSAPSEESANEAVP